MILRLTMAISTVTLSGCLLVPENETPLYCDAETPCENPEPSFCDLHGVYEASEMVGRTCIVPPPGVCKNDDDCDGSLPVCGELQRPNAKGEQFTVSECRACTAGATGDSECMAKDAAAPICESGACVECRTSADCTTDASEPRCDTETGQCVGCVENSDCASEVCDTDSGQCADAADVVYVATNGADGAACGTQASRCLTIGGAQGGLNKVTASRKTLKLSDGVYAESVSISALEVKIIGPATVNPSANNQPAFDIDGGANVSLVEMVASLANGDANADGVVCGGSSTLSIGRSTIGPNSATGIEANTCALTVSQSTVSGNLAGGLDINASSFDIQNNFIVSNGAGGLSGSATGGLSISSAPAGSVLAFNTIVDSNTANSITAGSAIDCTASAQAAVSNNIVFISSSAAPLNGDCSLTYSNVEGGTPGTGNIDDDPMFADAVGGDFHLQTGSPCIDMADPAANLTIDVDGDRRPQGARHDIGADEIAQ